MEESFRTSVTSSADAQMLHAHAEDGEFHIKVGVSRDRDPMIAVKINGSFSNNATLGLPTIQGSIYLADSTTGQPLAIIDSGLLTRMRTASTTAVATKYLSDPESTILAVCGTGVQAHESAVAIAAVRKLREIRVWGRDSQRAKQLAELLRTELDVTVVSCDVLRGATYNADIIVTATSSRKPFVSQDDVSPSTFIAAIGADSPDKQELDARLVAQSVVIADIEQQSATVGEVHHAISAGLMRASSIFGTLGQVITGDRSIASTIQRTIIFDSTGTAMQDLAAARLVFAGAAARGLGIDIDLSS